MITATIDLSVGFTQVPSPKYLNVGWNEYQEKMLTVALKIFKDGFVPDHIICIGRGGSLFGDALSRVFGKKLSVVMCSSYVGDGEMKQGGLNIAEHISSTQKLAGKVLLVDDLVDSGDTLIALKREIKLKHPDVTDIKTAVIYKKTGSKFDPDYHGDIIDKEVWIYQPNENLDRVKLSSLSRDVLKNLSEELIGQLAKNILESLPENPTLEIPEGTFNNLAKTLL